jgi:hypothetical protein
MAATPSKRSRAVVASLALLLLGLALAPAAASASRDTERTASEIVDGVTGLVGPASKMPERLRLPTMAPGEADAPRQATPPLVAPRPGPNASHEPARLQRWRLAHATATAGP